MEAIESIIILKIYKKEVGDFFPSFCPILLLLLLLQDDHKIIVSYGMSSELLSLQLQLLQSVRQ